MFRADCNGMNTTPHQNPGLRLKVRLLEPCSMYLLLFLVLSGLFMRFIPNILLHLVIFKLSGRLLPGHGLFIPCLPFNYMLFIL